MPALPRCVVCAERCTLCKSCVDGDKFRVLPALALLPWHHAPVILGYEHDKIKLSR